MPFEEMERTMQFILQKQARFDADIARINEALDKNREARGGSAPDFRYSDEQSDGRRKRLARIEEKMLGLEEKMTNLAEAEKRTDERLNSFIDFFERYLSSRNGGERNH